jgi:hypothetical protein
MWGSGIGSHYVSDRTRDPDFERGTNMNVRWGRGFFRIWLVLSVLWIAGAVWVETRPLSPGLLPTPQAECEAAEARSGVKTPDCVAAMEFVFDAARRQQKTDAEKMAWVLVPPVLLLLAGAAVAWAVRGFRR